MKQLKSLKRDGKGYLYRNLGWLSQNGRDKQSQPKFLLGRDEGHALDRLRRLERLWSLIEQHHRTESFSGKPTWDQITLAVGKAISRGDHIFHLDRQNQQDTTETGAAWADADYAGYLRSMQEAYPVITFVPAESEAFQNGIRKNIEIAESHQLLADDFAKDAGQPTVRDLNETLHKAIKAYVAAIDQDPRFQTHESSPVPATHRLWIQAQVHMLGLRGPLCGSTAECNVLSGKRSRVVRFLAKSTETQGDRPADQDRYGEAPAYGIEPVFEMVAQNGSVLLAKAFGFRRDRPKS